MAELDPELYTIAWLAPLEIEAQAALHMLDTRHQGKFPIGRGDDYIFQAGDLCGHNIIIATLPAGQEYGTGSAAALASQVKSFFPNLWFGLLVGVAAGLPNLFQSPPLDIRLGDVLVGLPRDESAGLIAYDLGKETGNDGFQLLRFGQVLANTETVVRSAIGSIKLMAPNDAEALLPYYEHIKHKEHTNGTFIDPGQEHDKLYEVDEDGTERLVEREQRPNSKRTQVWYGPIGSGEKLMKNARKRNELRDKYNVIGLEMEAAGTMNRIPVGVIRGVCDYGDEHKNKEWQPYAAAMAAAYAKAVLSEIRPKPNKAFSVSFSLSEVAETEYFCARQKELAEIHSELSGDGSRRTVILHGLGGIGKTQLAVAYAKHHRADYSAIFWLNSKDEDSLKQSFASAARRILQGHPSASRLSAVDEKDLDNVVVAVKSWLNLPRNTRWLIVYDNYDNPKLPGNADRTAVDIRQFLPEAYQGSIIITTRSSQVEIGHRIRVGKLEDVQDGLDILSHASGRERLMEDPDAVKLAKELDGLPLALATAGRYLYNVSESFSDYLRLYKTSWLELQHTSPQVSSYEDQAFYSTWQLSLDHIKRQNELSALLLQLWAYFDNQDIWFELLQHNISDGPEWFSQLTKNKLSFNQVVRVLCDHGLVEVDISSSESEVESKGYSMHSCVHSWTTHFLNQEWDVSMARLAMECVGSHVPDRNARKAWATQRRLIRHAARCWYFLENSIISEDGMAWLLGSLGNLYLDQGKLGEAEKMYQRALNGREKAFGPDHPLTLTTVENLGLLYANRGKLVEAEGMYQRALEGREKALGLDHLSTLAIVDNLGLLYASQGKLVEAEEMYQRALKGTEEALGPNHPSTLRTVNNLGILYTDQSKAAEAEEMYRRALKGREKALGPDHPSTLRTVNNLGILYDDQGKLVEAEEMYQRSLKGYKKALGLCHPVTLTILNNLGVLYTNQCKLVEAEELYQHALKGYEKTLGLDHPSTLGTVNNLGLLYASQGKPVEAEEMYQRALKGRKKALGPDHPSTLRTVRSSGILGIAWF